MECMECMSMEHGMYGMYVTCLYRIDALLCVVLVLTCVNVHILCVFHVCVDVKL